MYLSIYVCMNIYLKSNLLIKKDKSTTTTTTAATVEGPLFKYKKKKKSIMVIYNFCNGCGTLKTKML